MYPPSASHQNGPIRNYTVSYTQGNEVITLYTHVSDTETYPLDISSQISVSSLLPYTEYTFTITATNDGGSSPSVTVTNTTNPSGKYVFYMAIKISNLFPIPSGCILYIAID